MTTFCAGRTYPKLTRIMRIRGLNTITWSVGIRVSGRRHLQMPRLKHKRGKRWSLLALAEGLGL